MSPASLIERQLLFVSHHGVQAVNNQQGKMALYEGSGVQKGWYSPHSTPFIHLLQLRGIFTNKD